MSAVTLNHEILWGTPVFTGTRVPVEALLQFLEAGESVDGFLQEFPSVKREMVVAYLAESKDALISQGSGAR